MALRCVGEPDFRQIQKKRVSACWSCHRKHVVFLWNKGDLLFGGFFMYKCSLFRVTIHWLLSWQAKLCQMNRLLKPAAGFHFSTVFICSILLSHGFSHVVQKLKHAFLILFIGCWMNSAGLLLFFVIYRSENDQQGEAIDYGPSIYTVNEQYIKPITAAAGKMSWALMMHPLGLDCDLFLWWSRWTLWDMVGHPCPQCWTSRIKALLCFALVHWGHWGQGCSQHPR